MNVSYTIGTSTELNIQRNIQSLRVTKVAKTVNVSLQKITVNFNIRTSKK